MPGDRKSRWHVSWRLMYDTPRRTSVQMPAAMHGTLEQLCKTLGRRAAPDASLGSSDSLPVSLTFLRIALGCPRSPSSLEFKTGSSRLLSGVRPL
jgi:hypothetical protein